MSGELEKRASDAEPAFETTSARGIAANRRAEIFVDF